MSLDALPAWRLRLARALSRPWVELFIGGLIIVSAGLTVADLTMEPGTHPALLFDDLGFAFTAAFAGELVLRRVATRGWGRYFALYWVDILAVAPLLRVFRIGRALRLLRLLRMMRLFGVFNRYATLFPYVFRRGTLEMLLVGGLVGLSVVFGSAALLAFEREQNGGMSFEHAFWGTLLSFIADQPMPSTPETLGGRIVIVVVMLTGLCTFALFTGTVSAFMSERLRRDGAEADLTELRDHTVVCGWNKKASIIAAEIVASLRGDNPVVVITEEKHPQLEPELLSHVVFVHGDFTSTQALRRAGIDSAKTCVILSDRSQGRSEQDADARTILAALTIEKLNPKVYTCAEVNNRSYVSHLELGKVNDFVVSGEHSAFLLAQASLNRGITQIMSELLTYKAGCQFYRVSVAARWKGKAYGELLADLRQRTGALLVGVCPPMQDPIVNPGSYELQGNEDVIVISSKAVQT